LTNMIARNFLENGVNILHPTIDMAGEKSGIIGSEFPFYNYLIYLGSVLFDYSHWIGRLINLFVSSFGLYFFYKLIKNLFDKQTAFNATIVLTVSIWFAFSRKIMPDTFSVYRKFITVCSLWFRTKDLQCPQSVSGRQQPFCGWCVWERIEE
jgi:Gpi18-like mannosyltransferase